MTLAAVYLSFLISSPVAAVPTAIPYVGYLADGNGAFDGTVAVSVELFDQAEEGVSLWGPYTFASVAVEAGIFTIIMGGADSPELESVLLPASGAWLDFAVDGEQLSPRQQLLSVPYAIAAGHAELCDEAATLGTQTAGDFAAALHDHGDAYVSEGEEGSITSTMLAEGTVKSVAIEDQTLLFADLGPNGCAAGDAIQFNGAGWACAPVLTAGESAAAFATADALAAAVARLDALEVSLAEQVAMNDDLVVTLADQEATIVAHAIAIAELQAQESGGGGGKCPADMVAVGDYCVDIVEASMWRRLDGGKVDCGAVQAAVEQAKAAPIGWDDDDLAIWYGGAHPMCAGDGAIPDLCQFEQFGNPPACNNFDSCYDYPEPENGSFSAPLYSCAIVGVAPARSCTWFQAQQACVFSGKRLCDNAEWQGAASGTPDPYAADPGGDTEPCNIWQNSKPLGSEWATVGQTIKAGTAKECVSSHGVYDMVGNLMELTADWWGQGPNSADGIHANPEYNKDGYWNVDVAEHSAIKPPFATLPATAHRGGAYDYGSQAGVFSICLTDGPAHHIHTVGYRCCGSP